MVKRGVICGLLLAVCITLLAYQDAWYGKGSLFSKEVFNESYELLYMVCYDGFFYVITSQEEYKISADLDAIEYLLASDGRTWAG